ncbi:MAG: amino acid permease, partial [Gemmataceae bacterium]
TYAYATLGELIAWIIGWDLILEYAMSAATVGSAWSEYFNKLTDVLFKWQVPANWSNDPFSLPGAYLNLPAVIILALVTVILVIGIRESAASNTALVVLKLGVVVFVIVLGIGYISTRNWTNIPHQERKLPEEALFADIAEDQAKKEEKRSGDDANERTKALEKYALATYKVRRIATIKAELEKANQLDAQEAERLDKLDKLFRADLPAAEADVKATDAILVKSREKAPSKEASKWGLLGTLGLNKYLAGVDNSTRSNFTPYGMSGIMLGAALVFFAFIGFDSISTHSEEAKKPQRDVPIGILASLLVCTILYMLVSAVITGMEPYPQINTKAAIAAAFDERAKVEQSGLLKASAALIAAGGLAGMTSVLLITFLSQARVFLAMARDGFMPKSIFGAVHAKFKTPHVSTILTGAIMAAVAAFTPIQDLEQMVNIGTLFAFVVVCAAVLILRFKRPEAHRPFRCPAVMIVAPVGIIVNVTMMLFLPWQTWARLVVWLIVGLVIYFGYGYWNSSLAKRSGELPASS